nr:alpha/beta hydrolase [Mycolicibacterium komanii]CRL75423.1 alpha/beta hydrolase [Mycolicibacterium komanii]
MSALSAFRSDDARAAYLRLYDAVLAGSAVPVTESDVETSYGRTHVLQAGDPSRPPLVALHGSSSSSTSWIPLLPILTATHRVTMLDAIDEVGKSAPTRPTSQPADLVAWLDEALQVLGIQRAGIVAASRGTWIATHFATVFPERVERLAFVCPVGIAGGMSPRFLFRGLTTIAVWPTERRVWSLLDSMVNPEQRRVLREEPMHTIMQQFASGTTSFKMSLGNAEPRPWPMRSDCDLHPIASARIPVLAIIGIKETAHNGRRAAAGLRQRLPDARIELVDANHLIPNEVVGRYLSDFLAHR